VAKCRSGSFSDEERGAGPGEFRMSLVGDRQRLVDVKGQDELLRDVTKRIAPDDPVTMKAPWGHC
jgi:hypothetical protein